MGRRRSAAWKSVLAPVAKRQQAEAMEWPEAWRPAPLDIEWERDGDLVLGVGMLKDVGPAAAREVARDVVRRFRHGAELSPIPWSGPEIADGWFALRNPEHAQETIGKMIEASTDPDAWAALSLIAARLHEERRPFPAELADWAALVHKGEVKAPPKRQGDRGRPPYANHRRNEWFRRVFFILRFLDLPAMECYAVIATELGFKSERTVKDGIEAARRLRSGSSDRSGA